MGAILSICLSLTLTLMCKHNNNSFETLAKLGQVVTRLFNQLQVTVLSNYCIQAEVKSKA